MKHLVFLCMLELHHSLSGIELISIEEKSLHVKKNSTNKINNKELREKSKFPINNNMNYEIPILKMGSFSYYHYRYSLIRFNYSK